MARGKKVAPKDLESALVPVAEQPYEVPGNWCWVRLGDAYEINPTYDLPQGKVAFMPMTLIPQGLASEPQYEMLESSKYAKGYKRFANGDVVFAKISPCFENRKSMIVEGLPSVVGAGTTELVVLRQPNIDLNYTYLLIIDERFIRDGAQFKGTVGQQRLRKGFVENYLMPLPPLAEQRRIVERIESLFAKLDEAEAKLQAILNASEQRQSAILHAAFTGKLTEKWREEHGLNLYSWAETTLGGCCKVGSGGTPSRKNPEYYTGQIPWVKTGEIDWGCITETEEHITQKAIEDSSAKLYEPGAVLVAMYGMGQTRGKAALLDIRAATNQAVCVFEPCEKLNRHFLFYFFRRNYGDVRSKSVGGNQLNLSATILRRLTISLPSVEEQTAIVAILDECLGKEIEAVAFVNAALATIDTLRQTILAKALHGELGTNDPADPSSLKLLEDILVSRGGST